MKKALVLDWLDKYGGAERVITILQKIFDFDKTYTLINVMDKDDLDKIYEKKKHQIIETPLKNSKKGFRFFFITFHYFVSKIKISKDIKLIISSSHAIAKGVKKSSSDQIHISYFQARNFKYIWDDYKLYFGVMGYFLYPLIMVLRKIDKNQSKNPDYIISNSIFVKEWIKKNYNRESHVIYPPVDIDRFILQQKKQEYYVAVGRLVKYKRFDIVIKAFNLLNKELYIIGDGDQLKNLKKLAKPNIHFTGFLNSQEVNEYVKNAKAFIHSGIEDFGIAPIEAQACGTPVIAYGIGGVLETVIKGVTGLFYFEQNEENLKRTIEEFEKLTFDPVKIRQHALQFSKERFQDEIMEYINNILYEESINS